MNPISAGTWLWKALRGHSVTFAGLLALALLGVSAIHWMKQGLYAVGTPWLAVLIIPTVLIGVLAKKEREWIPEEARRKFWARSIIGGAVLLAVVVALLRPEKPSVQPSGQTMPAADKALRPKGPSGK